MSSPSENAPKGTEEKFEENTTNATTETNTGTNSTSVTSPSSVELPKQQDDPNDDDISKGHDGDDTTKAKVVHIDEVTEDEPRIEPKPQRPIAIAVALGFLMILLGMCNGINFVSSGVPAPIALREQMVFKIWIVMKMFISAVGASMIFQSIYRLSNKEHFEKSRFYRQSSVGYARAIIGCAILGIGMALAGSGPTMIPAQIGSGILTGPYCIAGGLLAALIFCVVEPFVFRTDICRKAGEVTTLDDKLGVSYHVLAIPAGLGMIIFSIVLEIIFTQKEDYPKTEMGPSKYMNYPTVTGVVHGLLQVPVRLISGDGHGGTEALVAFWATLTCGKLSPRHRIDTVEKSYQLLFVWLGVPLGALLWSQTVPDWHAPDSYGFAYSFIGGFLQVAGSRIANGCTCGHGISGLSELSLQSIFATCAIFGGAIVTGFVLVGAGEIEFP